MNTTKNNNRKLFGKEEENAVRTLTKYYPLDEATNTFEIGLRYERASDLFEENADTLERVSRISESITDRMAEALEDIPNGYSADISIRVDDFEGYSPGQLMDGLKDALSLRHRRFLYEATRNGLKKGALIVAGIVMILILTIGKQIGWWGGDDTVSEILTYMLDTLGCVLIWEGLYMVFLEEPEEYVFEKKISHKLSSISFCQDNKAGTAVSESRENISALMEINRKKLLAKRLLLFSGYSLICLSVAWVLQTLGIIINPEKFGEKVNTELIVDMGVAIMAGAAGVLSLLSYEEKMKDSPTVLVFAAAVILYPTVNGLIVLFRKGSTLIPIRVILVICIIIAGLTFLVGHGMDYILYRQERRRDHSEEKINEGR
ncbi:MAG: hypothetical protein IJ242_13240 [Clostridia bacterium]|nr:hypothetical protein [Clostridia bacterium]